MRGGSALALRPRATSRDTIDLFETKHKGRALVRRAFHRRVIERFDLAPALFVERHFFNPAIQLRITLTGVGSPTCVPIKNRCPSAVTSYSIHG